LLGDRSGGHGHRIPLVETLLQCQELLLHRHSLSFSSLNTGIQAGNRNRSGIVRAPRRRRKTDRMTKKKKKKKCLLAASVLSNGMECETRSSDLNPCLRL
jgi:hypothetical protein